MAKSYKYSTLISHPSNSSNPMPLISDPAPEWIQSDQYHNSFLIPKDEILEKTVANGAAENIDIEIAVSPAQGKFQYLLAKSIRAKRILEVGTLAGYSGIWFARALPSDGELVCLEIDPVAVRVRVSIVPDRWSPTNVSLVNDRFQERTLRPRESPLRSKLSKDRDMPP